MFDYTIYPESDEKIFKALCDKLDKIEEFEKGKLLMDVDDSLIQLYKWQGIDVDVFNDTEVGAIFIKSEKDISDILNASKITYSLHETYHAD